MGCAGQIITRKVAQLTNLTSVYLEMVSEYQDVQRCMGQQRENSP